MYLSTFKAQTIEYHFISILFCAIRVSGHGRHDIYIIQWWAVSLTWVILNPPGNREKLKMGERHEGGMIQQVGRKRKWKATTKEKETKIVVQSERSTSGGWNG